jgi:hypothetical protein
MYCTASGRIASLHLGVHQAHARDDSGSRAGVLEISCPVLEISCPVLEISWMAWGSLGMAWAKLVWMSSVAWHVYAVVEYSISIDKYYIL